MQERSFEFCIKLVKTPLLSASKKDNNSCQTLSLAAVEIFSLYKEISCNVSSSIEKFIFAAKRNARSILSGSVWKIDFEVALMSALFKSFFPL